MSNDVSDDDDECSLRLVLERSDFLYLSEDSNDEDMGALDESLSSLAMRCAPSSDTDTTPVSSPVSAVTPEECFASSELILGIQDSLSNVTDSREGSQLKEIQHLLSLTRARVTEMGVARAPSAEFDNVIQKTTDLLDLWGRKCMCDDCRVTNDVWKKIFPKESITLVATMMIRPNYCGQCKTTYSSVEALASHFSVSHLFSEDVTRKPDIKPFNLLTTELRTFFDNKSSNPSPVGPCSSSGESNSDSRWSESDESYSCNLCNYVTPSQQYIVRHVRTHKGETRSGNTFIRPTNRGSSREKLSVQRNLRCSICRRRFSNKRSFTKHAWWHKRIKGEIVTCEDIRTHADSMSPQQLAANNEITPPSNKPIRCAKCFETFLKRDLRNLHEMSCKTVKPKSVVKSTPKNETELDTDNTAKYIGVIKSSTGPKTPGTGGVDRGRTGRHRKHRFFSKKTEGSDIFRCTDCDFATFFQRRMKLHQRTHRAERARVYRMRPCPHCNAQLFGIISIVEEHIQLFHKTAKKRVLKVRKSNVTNGHFCSICQRYGFSMFGLKLHNSRCHRNQKSNAQDRKNSVERTLNKGHVKRLRKKPRLKSLDMAIDAVLDRVISPPSSTREKTAKVQLVDTAVSLPPVDRPFEAFKNCRIIESVNSHVSKSHGSVISSEQRDVVNSTEDQQEHDPKEAACLRCSLCSYSCSHRGLFSIHMRQHRDKQMEYSDSEREILECGYCKFSTLERRHLLEHRRTHARENLRRCPLCSFKCNTWKRLQHHLEKHRSLHSEKLSCTFCEFSTRRRGVFLVHMKTHDTSDEHVCTQCDFRTKKLSVLRFHTRKHLARTGKKIFECAHCNYVTNHIRDLRIHAPLHLKLLEFEKTPNVDSATERLPENQVSNERKSAAIEERIFLRSSNKSVISLSEDENETEVFRETDRVGEPDHQSLVGSRVETIERRATPPPFEVVTIEAALEMRKCRDCDYVAGEDEDISIHIDACHGDASDLPIRITAVTSLAGNEPCYVELRDSPTTERTAEAADDNGRRNKHGTAKRKNGSEHKSNIVVSDQILSTKQPRCVECNKTYPNHVDLSIHRMAVHAETEGTFIFAENIEDEVVSMESADLDDGSDTPEEEPVRYFHDASNDSDIEYVATYELGETTDLNRVVSCKECDLDFNSEPSFMAHMNWHGHKDQLSNRLGERNDPPVSEDSDVEFIADP